MGAPIFRIGDMLPRLSDLQRRQLTPRQIRLGGWVMVACGLFLLALTGAVGALLLDIIALSDIIPGTYRDPTAGPPESSVGAYAFIGFCFVFGLVSTAAGFYQVWTGRRSEKLLSVMLVLGALFAAAGMIVRGLS
jgi:hypothetical protein